MLTANPMITKVIFVWFILLLLINTITLQHIWIKKICTSRCALISDSPKAQYKTSHVEYMQVLPTVP
jgi:hypothetical protein